MQPTRGQRLGMETDRRKNASLAIKAVLRGLEFDQLVFHHDETACPDIGTTAGGRGFGASGGRTVPVASSSSLLLKLPPLARTTTAA